MKRILCVALMTVCSACLAESSFFENGPSLPFWVFVLAAIAFGIVREFTCWYFKINEIVEKLERLTYSGPSRYQVDTMIKLLEEINEKLRQSNSRS